MEITELKQKTAGELQKIIQDNKEKLRNLRFDLVSGKVKNIREIRRTRKDIARIMTILGRDSEKVKQSKNKI